MIGVAQGLSLHLQHIFQDISLPVNHNKISKGMDLKTVCVFRAGMDALPGMQVLFSTGKLVHIPLRYSDKYMFYPKSHKLCPDQIHHPTLPVAHSSTSQIDCNGALNSEHCGLRFASTCYGICSNCRDRVGWNMFARIGVRLLPWYKWPWPLFPSNRDWCHVQQTVRFVN